MHRSFFIRLIEAPNFRSTWCCSVSGASRPQTSSFRPSTGFPTTPWNLRTPVPWSTSPKSKLGNLDKSIDAVNPVVSPSWLYISKSNDAINFSFIKPARWRLSDNSVFSYLIVCRTIDNLFRKSSTCFLL